MMRKEQEKADEENQEKGTGNQAGSDDPKNAEDFPAEIMRDKQESVWIRQSIVLLLALSDAYFRNLLEKKNRHSQSSIVILYLGSRQCYYYHTRKGDSGSYTASTFPNNYEERRRLHYVTCDQCQGTV